MKVKIVETKTMKKVSAVIEPLTNKDLGAIDRYNEKWLEFITEYEYATYSIFKLRMTESNLILGLLCVIEELILSKAVEIRKIELIAENIGSKKKYDNIAGCLIAFACQHSIDKGLGGKVVLIPKPELKNHYCLKYRMTPFVGFLKIDTNNARLLIEEYL